MYLVFDIGGTNMRVGVSSDGSIFKDSKIVPTPKDFDQGIQALKQTADELSKGEKIAAAAGGVAGPLDKQNSRLVSSPHLPDWIEKPLKQKLESLIKCPIFLENDSALGGLSEAVLGAGKNHLIVGYVASGTGIGGVRIVNSKIDENSLGFEPGHQIIVPDGKPCNCGGKGHLESYVGGLNIEKNYHQKAEEINDPKIWDEIAKFLAIGLNNLIVLWSPDIIVLGGSVTKSLPLDKVNSYLKGMLKIFPYPPQIVKAAFGDEAGLYGALEYLKQNLFK